MNMTWLTRLTNNWIRNLTPEIYVKRLIDQRAATAGRKQAEKRVRRVLATHLIDDDGFDALLSNDYDRFIRARSASVYAYLQDQFDIRISLGESDGEEAEDVVV